MKEIVSLEWAYTPEDFFLEEPLKFKGAGYELKIERGKIIAVLEDTFDTNNVSSFDKIHEDVVSLFTGFQVLSQKPYGLSKYSLHKVHQDGRKDVTVFLNTLPYELGTPPVDVKITDSEGKTITDTGAAKQKEKERLMELALKFRSVDTVAKLILQSNSNAISDPANELIHLYEIRDCLKNEFGGKRNAQNSLNVSDKEWDNFDELANNAPLKQGRHRGSHPDGLRDATEAELTQARGFAKKLIFSYFEFLEKAKSK